VEEVIVRFRLLPADEGFFSLFCDAATNASQCAGALAKLLSDPLDASAVEEVIDHERRGDAITAAVLKRLDTSFVTPFDREDIHALAEEFDDVVDDMHTVAQRIQLLAVRSTVPWLTQQAELLVDQAGEAIGLMDKLRTMKGLSPHLEAIDRLESEADTVYNEALAQLFSGEFEALDVLRWKDLVEAMEAAINTMEDIGDIVESIMLKHA
jgi:predicted phosphate transport protein (TIGR00153 family)